VQRAKLIVYGCANYTSQNPAWNNAEWLDSLLYVRYLPWGTGSERMIVWDTTTKQFMKRPITTFTATPPLEISSGLIKSRKASSSDSGYIDPVHYTNWNTAFGWGNHAGLYRPINYVPSWGEITGKPTFASVATSGTYQDLISKPTTDGSETKVTAGSNVTVTGTGTNGSPYIINSTGNTSHYIGEIYEGGKVFYISDGGLHGLIAATTDQSTAIQWYNGSNTMTNAVRDKIYSGQQNTERIIINQGGGSYAAQICANYQGGDYGDWYLPSKYELNLLYLQQTVVGSFASGNYWSSSEFDANNVWTQDFASGTQQTINKVTTFNVRAVRAF